MQERVKRRSVIARLVRPKRSEIVVPLRYLANDCEYSRGACYVFRVVEDKHVLRVPFALPQNSARDDRLPVARQGVLDFDLRVKDRQR